MKPTIYDVAKETGLSIATVSRVINKNGKVKAETENKVLAAIKKLGYEPSIVAQGLAKNKTGMLSLLLNRFGSQNSESQYSIRFIYGFLNAAALNNYEVLIKNIELDDIGGPFEGSSLQTDGAAFITVPENEQRIRVLVEKDRPVVYAGMRQSFDNIGRNIYGGYHQYRKELLDILFERGYRNVLMVDHTLSIVSEMNAVTRKTIDETVEGYSKYGFKLRECSGNNFSEEIENIFNGSNPPDSMIVHGLELYIELSEILSRNNISVPEDIAVVGVSHSRSSGAEFTPEISTIYLDAFEMGRRSGELLIKFINGDDVSAVQRDVPYTFIDRGSIPFRQDSKF